MFFFRSEDGKIKYCSDVDQPTSNLYDWLWQDPCVAETVGEEESVVGVYTRFTDSLGTRAELYTLRSVDVALQLCAC